MADVVDNSPATAAATAATDDGAVEVEAKPAKVDAEEFPKAALLQQAERIVAASEEELQELLLGLGGAIGDIVARDGKSVEQAEVMAALAQIGAEMLSFSNLIEAVIAQENEAAKKPGSRGGGSASKRSKPKGKKGKGAKGGDDAPEQGEKEEIVTITKPQFEQVVVLAAKRSLPRLAMEAAEERKPRTIIKDKDVAHLRSLEDPMERVHELATLLNHTDHRADVRSGIEVDFFVHHLFKCFDEQVDDLRTAIFLTVMKQVLDAANQTGWSSPQDSFADFKEFFVRYCDTGAGGEYEPFTVDQARALTKHVAETFFRFYSSFKFAFTKEREREEVTDEVFVEEPMAARPLREATQSE